MATMCSGLLTLDELLARIERSVNDYRNGKITTQENLEKLSKS
jgi:hypothetical protein